MAGASVIDDYVADLDTRLRGNRKTKLDMVTEARDSLEDAADCYRSAGLCDEDAQRKAVADFGPVGAIARDFQGELAVAYGTRTLRSILFILPALHLGWELSRLIFLGPWENLPAGNPPPAWYMPLTQINDSMPWAVSIATALALLVGRLMSRRIADNRLIARCAAGVALVTVSAALLSNLSLGIASTIVNPQLMLSTPLVLLASVAAIAVLARLTVMARKAVRFAV
ncbi:permease prefix domain 1-containing protein [Kibdelosporangium philippinense]|uniref:Permease prefix domain 1-containing protein n=1 Tax=Kibdelosporangium philippinense TaxID=211113 RepID=A0ABS8ZLS9_9PSEU|nr:permease prefix domain 1-containing protein [Kibdelosporangium philippinense]MCE7008467.1 permease prefix domain 1-containing protein [Kibdelosporangium philippinense]